MTQLRMPILQQQPLETDTTKQIIAAALNAQQDLEYPRAPRPTRTSKAVMPIVLWSLCLLLGILMLFVRTPLHAPPFESLSTCATHCLASRISEIDFSRIP
jgi:hypothetical protein